MDNPAMLTASSGSVPSGFDCPCCGYFLGQCHTPICSECGHAISASDVEHFQKRHAAYSELPAIKRRHHLWASIICTACAIMEGGFSLQVGYFFMVLVATFLAFGWCVLVGNLCIQWAPAHIRAAMHASWIRSQLWLMMPWMSILFCMLALAVGLMADYYRVFTREGHNGFAIVMSICGLWIFSNIIWLGLWIFSIRANKLTFGLRQYSARWLIVSGIFVFVPSIIVGFVGGLVGTAAVAEGPLGKSFTRP